MTLILILLLYYPNQNEESKCNKILSLIILPKPLKGNNHHVTYAPWRSQIGPS